MPPRSVRPVEKTEDDSGSDNDLETRVSKLESQMTSLNTKVDQILALLSQKPTETKPPLPSSEPKPRSSSLEATVKDIGIFDPDDTSEQPVWTESKETVYGDVTLFVKKLRRLAARKVVYGYTIADCLRGKAVTWYEGTNSEELERAGIEQWCTALLAQFSMPREYAVRTLKRTHYTIQDALSCTPLTSYYDRICRCARVLEYTEQQTTDYLFDNIYTEIVVHLQDLKLLNLTEIRVRFAQRQLLITNFSQGLYNPRKAIEPPSVDTSVPPSQQYQYNRSKEWRNNKNARKAYFLKQEDLGGGGNNNDPDDQYNISV